MTLADAGRSQPRRSQLTNGRTVQRSPVLSSRLSWSGHRRYVRQSTRRWLRRRLPVYSKRSSACIVILRAMKIATWNLDRVRPGLGARSARIREALGHIDADVWVLTESHPQFAPAAEYRHISMSAQAPDRVHGGCWVTIWVRDGIPADALGPHRGT